MHLTRRHNLCFWEFDLLKNCKEISHGSFTRHGGVSAFPFSSLNVGKNLGDPFENVDENIGKITRALGVSRSLPCFQCHSSDIHIIRDVEAPIPPCDALITQLPDVALLIKHADCQAGLFYDPVTRVIANVHSGWRGSVLGVYTKTIHALQKHFGTRPEDLLVCISPSLGPENAEFKNFRKEFPSSFFPFQVKPNYFDFWAISEYVLRQAGVLPHHIEIARQCTVASPEHYFSYRGEKVSGRLGTAIALRSST